MLMSYMDIGNLDMNVIIWYKVEEYVFNVAFLFLGNFGMLWTFEWFFDTSLVI